MVRTDIQMEMVMVQLVGRGRQHHREITAGARCQMMQEIAPGPRRPPVSFDADFGPVGEAEAGDVDGQAKRMLAEPVAVGEPYAYPVAEEPERIPLFPAGTREIVVTSFVVDAPPGWEPTLDWEHDDYRWCTAAEACALFHWPEPSAQLRLLTGATV